MDKALTQFFNVLEDENAPAATDRHKYRYLPKSYTWFLQRDKPHPTRATWLDGITGIPHRKIEDFRMYDGFQHSRSLSNMNRTSLQGSPNQYVDSRLQAYRKNLAGHHLAQRTNLILTARERIPTFNENVLNDYLNQRILAEILSFTSALTEPPKNDGSAPLPAPVPLELESPENSHRKRISAMYSERSGRLIPPPSRSTARPVTSSTGLQSLLTGWKAGLSIDLIADPQQRLLVEVLCQLLQTDDLLVAAAWIGTASDTEKQLLIHLLQLAVRARVDEMARNGGSAVSDGKFQQPSYPKTVFPRLSMPSTAPAPPATAPAKANSVATAPSVKLPQAAQPQRLSIRRNLPEYDHIKDVYAAKQA